MAKLVKALVILGGCLWAVLVPRPVGAQPRTVRCCLPVDLPGVEEINRCTPVVLRVRRRHGAPARVCRRAGGRPLRPGSGCVCR